MNKNKAVSAKDGSNTHLIEQLTMTNHKPNQHKFQYECSFCLRELPSGGHRFDGIGACPAHYALAFKLVDSLRAHRARYFSNLGVRK